MPSPRPASHPSAPRPTPPPPSPPPALPDPSPAGCRPPPRRLSNASTRSLGLPSRICSGSWLLTRSPQAHLHTPLVLSKGPADSLCPPRAEETPGLRSGKEGGPPWAGQHLPGGEGGGQNRLAKWMQVLPSDRPQPRERGYTQRGGGRDGKCSL